MAFLQGYLTNLEILYNITKVDKLFTYKFLNMEKGSLNTVH